MSQVLNRFIKNFYKIVSSKDQYQCNHDKVKIFLELNDIKLTIEIILLSNSNKTVSPLVNLLTATLFSHLIMLLFKSDDRLYNDLVTRWGQLNFTWYVPKHFNTCVGHTHNGKRKNYNQYY